MRIKENWICKAVQICKGIGFCFAGVRVFEGITVQYRVEVAQIGYIGKLNIYGTVGIAFSESVMIAVKIVGLLILQYRTVDSGIRYIKPCENIRIFCFQRGKVDL